MQRALHTARAASRPHALSRTLRERLGVRTAVVPYRRRVRARTRKLVVHMRTGLGRSRICA